MKRIKLFFAAATLCAAAAVGYYAYEQATMTEEERIMQANIEALSNDETISATCNEVGVDTKCAVQCSSCGMVWSTSENGVYVSGSATCTCGNKL